MFEEVVHVQGGPDEKSICGLNLRQGAFVPYLYTHCYHPAKHRYAVHRVLALDENYPVYEQIAVLNNPSFCPECLSELGMRALVDIL